MQLSNHCGNLTMHAQDLDERLVTLTDYLTMRWEVCVHAIASGLKWAAKLGNSQSAQLCWLLVMRLIWLSAVQTTTSLRDPLCSRHLSR